MTAAMMVGFGVGIVFTMVLQVGRVRAAWKLGFLAGHTSGFAAATFAAVRTIDVPIAGHPSIDL